MRDSIATCAGLVMLSSGIALLCDASLLEQSSPQCPTPVTAVINIVAILSIGFCAYQCFDRHRDTTNQDPAPRERNLSPYDTLLNASGG